MVISVFILLAQNIIMIWFSIERDKWVDASSNHLYTVKPVDQSNNEPISRRDTEVKQGRLEVCPVALGNFDYTFAIIMWFFHLLIKRFKIPIITTMLLWIATTWHIHAIDPLKATNIFVVGRL